MDELSYTHPGDSALRLWFMRTVEDLSGRKRILPLYWQWRDQVANSDSPRMWAEALKMLQIRLAITAPVDWQKSIAPGSPTILIANHPFGIADGLVLLALLEQTGRSYRVILHSDIMRVPEMRKVGLPIDFSGTKEALRVNLETRAEVRRLLKEGVVIAVFPAGGVATAEDPFGTAEELPWKNFVARLVRQYHAQVLPVYFEGQNSPLFHWVSRYSQTLRLSLLIREFWRRFDSTINLTIGHVVEYSRIPSSANDESLIAELYVMVHRLAPGAEGKHRSALLPRDPQLRRQFPCDAPLIVER